MLNLDEIDKRSAAATPGPWWVYRCDEGHVHEPDEACGVSHAEGDGFAGKVFCDAAFDECHHIISAADAEFIAAARTDVPALIARVRELEHARLARPCDGLCGSKRGAGCEAADRRAAEAERDKAMAERDAAIGVFREEMERRIDTSVAKMAAQRDEACAKLNSVRAKLAEVEAERDAAWTLATTNQSLLDAATSERDRAWDSRNHFEELYERAEDERDSLRAEHRAICEAMPSGPGLLPDRVRRIVDERDLAQRDYLTVADAISPRSDGAADLVSKVRALRAKANEVPGLSATLDEVTWERDSLRAKLAEVEATCAVMREALKLAIIGDDDDERDDEAWVIAGCPSAPTIVAACQAALAPDAGRALLQEVVALREVAEATSSHLALRDYVELGRGSLAAALAKLNALKGG